MRSNLRKIGCGRGQAARTLQHTGCYFNVTLNELMLALLFRVNAKFLDLWTNVCWICGCAPSWPLVMTFLGDFFLTIDGGKKWWNVSNGRFHFILFADEIFVKEEEEYCMEERFLLLRPLEISLPTKDPRNSFHPEFSKTRTAVASRGPLQRNPAITGKSKKRISAKREALTYIQCQGSTLHRVRLQRNSLVVKGLEAISDPPPLRSFFLFLRPLPFICLSLSRVFHSLLRSDPGFFTKFNVGDFVGKFEVKGLKS